MHPTRAASLLAALGAALIAAALLLRALALGQAFSTTAQSSSAAQPLLPALGGYIYAPDGQTISFIQAPFSAPRALVNWFSMPVNGGIPASGTAPFPDLRPFRVNNGKVFVSAQGNTGVRQVSPPGEQVLYASRSPDGKALAFAAKTEGGRFRLYVLNEDFKLQWLGEEDTIIDLDWSQDSQMLAFAAAVDSVDQVFAASADGQAYRQLTRDGTRKSRPRWSPDGSTIAYLAIEGGYSLTVGLATPTAPPVILYPTLTPAPNKPRSGPLPGALAQQAAPQPAAARRVDVFLINADGSNPRRLTDSPEQEMALSWLHSSRGAELAYAVRLAEHPQVAYLYAVEPTSGKTRRVYPALSVESMECPTQIALGSPALVRITVSNSALVPQDLPLILRAQARPFYPYEDIQSSAVHKETLSLLPGETRVLEWEIRPSAGRTTYLSVIANTTPRLPISERVCSAQNSYFGLPQLPYLPLSLPFLFVGMLLCVPRLLQLRSKFFWFLWAAALVAFWVVFGIETSLR